MTEPTNLTTTLQTIRDYCDSVLANSTPSNPESASRMVAARVREMAEEVEQVDEPGRFAKRTD